MANLKLQRRTRLEQRGRAIQTLTIVVLLVILIQMWLVTIALEEYFVGRSDLAVGTFLASGACFLVNLGLLKYLYDVDRLKD